MNIQDIQNDSDLQNLAEEAQSKSRWAMAYRALTGLFAIGTLAVGALPFVGMGAVFGGVGEIALAAIGMGASTVAVHLSANSAVEEAGQSRERLESHLRKKEQGITDEDLGKQVRELRDEVSALKEESHAQSQSSSYWRDKHASNDRSGTWRDMVESGSGLDSRSIH